MPTKVEMVRSIKTIKFISFDKLLWEKETRTVVNPFSNLLEMLECYCSIADKQDMERLKIFVRKSQSEENASLLVFLVLAIFIFLPYSASLSSLLSSDAKYFILFASNPKAFNITFWFAVTA